MGKRKHEGKLESTMKREKIPDSDQRLIKKTISGLTGKLTLLLRVLIFSRVLCSSAQGKVQFAHGHTRIPRIARRSKRTSFTKSLKSFLNNSLSVCCSLKREKVDGMGASIHSTRKHTFAQRLQAQISRFIFHTVLINVVFGKNVTNTCGKYLHTIMYTCI